ncbi:Ff.00g079180.m01.CDS01 [Fusarium sp. VM40]|nr:Ff.00g079180.m01.CDS01 [Fusarium sp. VM40]
MSHLKMLSGLCPNPWRSSTQRDVPNLVLKFWEELGGRDQATGFDEWHVFEIHDHHYINSNHPGSGGLDAFTGDEFTSVRMVESEQLGGFIAAAADSGLRCRNYRRILCPLSFACRRDKKHTQRLVVVSWPS